MYHYTYAGEELDLSTVVDTVYRKNGSVSLGSNGADLASANFGPVHLSNFSGLQLQTFNLKQGDKNGYSVYVDPENGLLTINGNEGLWGYTNEYKPLTENDILSDEETIALANAFVSKYGIELGSFGTPVIDKRGVVYALSQPVDQRYIPDAVSVTYPLMVDGQPVFSSDGSAYGMTIMVNMRTKAVSSATVYVADSYDRSTYELERDAATVLGYAEQGGLYSYAEPDGATVVDIELGTPSLILMSHYNYTSKGSENLLIPALSFPITKNSAEHPLYQEVITVPLVKNILDEAKNSNPDVHILDTKEAE